MIGGYVNPGDYVSISSPIFGDTTGIVLEIFLTETNRNQQPSNPVRVKLIDGRSVFVTQWNCWKLPTLKDLRGGE